MDRSIQAATIRHSDLYIACSAQSSLGMVVPQLRKIHPAAKVALLTATIDGEQFAERLGLGYVSKVQLADSLVNLARWYNKK